jgi:hypothetical protein
MDDVTPQVLKLLQAKKKVSIFCTGAGAGAGKLIWDVPGASSTLVKFSVPYDQTAFNQEIGFDWKSTGKGYCSREGAIALAQAAYLSAQRACTEGTEAIGVGLSAAASTGRVLRGGTRCFAAVRTNFSLETVEVWFEQGFLGREAEGKICDLIALNLVLRAADLEQIPLRWYDLHVTSDNVSVSSLLSPSEVLPEQQTIDGGILIDRNGAIQSPSMDFSQCIIFSGSFNPFHFGHDGIAHLVSEITGKQVIFEITAANADKDPLSEISALVRATAQFAYRWPVIVRKDCGLFLDKIKAYKGASFVVGYDTAVRILDERFYQTIGITPAQVLSAFNEAGAVFYVAPRLNGDGLADGTKLPVDPALRHLFQPIQGRWDVCSSDLRK